MSCRCNRLSKPKTEIKSVCPREKENAKNFSSSKYSTNVVSTTKPHNSGGTQSTRTPLSDLKTQKNLVPRAGGTTSSTTKTVKNTISSVSVKNNSAVKTNTNIKTVANIKSVAASKNVSVSSIKSCAKVATTKNNVKTVSGTTNKTTNTNSNTALKNTSVNNSKPTVSNNINKCNNSSNTAVKNKIVTNKIVPNVGNTIKNTSNKFTPAASSTIISKAISSNTKTTSVSTNKLISRSNTTIISNTASSNVKNTSLNTNIFLSRSNSTIINKSTSLNINNTSLNVNNFLPRSNSTLISSNTSSSYMKNTSNNTCSVKATPNKITTINNSVTKSVLTNSTCSSTLKLTPNTSTNSTLQCVTNRNTIVSNNLKIAANNTPKPTNRTPIASKNVSNNYCSNVALSKSVANKNTTLPNTISVTNKNSTAANTTKIISSNCANNKPNKFINTVVPANKINKSFPVTKNYAITPLKNSNSVVLNTKSFTSNTTIKTATNNSTNLSMSAVSTNSTALKVNINNSSITAVNKSTSSSNVSINTTGYYTCLPNNITKDGIFPKISSSGNNICIQPSNFDINLTDAANLKVDSRNGTKIESSSITLDEIKPKNNTFGTDILETITENPSNTMQATLSSEIVQTDIFRKTDSPIIQDSLENLEIVHIQSKPGEDKTPLTYLTVTDKENTLITSLDKITCKSVKFSPEIIEAEIFSTPDTAFIVQSENIEHFSKTDTPFSTFNKIKPKSAKFSSEISKIETCSTCNSPVTIKCETIDIDQTESTTKANNFANSRKVTFNTFSSTIPAVEISRTPSNITLNKMFPLACSTATKCSKNDTLFPTTYLLQKISPCAKSDSGMDQTSGFWQTFQVIKNDFNKNKSVINCNTTQIYSNTSTNEKLERSVNDGIPKEKTFKKEILKPSEFLGVVNLDSNTHKVHPLVLYPDDLLHDVITHIITHQEEYKLKVDYLEENIELCEMRSIVVNWLIKLHQYLAPDTCILFMVIRLFDKILAQLNIPENKYQIFALTTYWIVLKYNNSGDFTTAPDILKLCNSKYSIDYFLVMEKQILQYLDYNMNVDEPMIFVYYFIYVMKLSDCNIISFCANYFLEILSLAHNCNYFPLSLQAASAVYLTLKLFDIDDSYWLVVKNYQGYHEENEMLSLHILIIEQILYMNEEEYPYRESYKKFSNEKYDEVSKKVAMKVAEFFKKSDFMVRQE